MGWGDQVRAEQRRKRKPLGKRIRKELTDRRAALTVTGGGDFKKRADKAKAAQARHATAEKRRQAAAADRAKETAARRARRAREEQQRRARRQKEIAAAKARRKKTPGRPRPSHPAAGCLNQPDCERPMCELYREAYWQGWADKPPEVIYVGGK